MQLISEQTFVKFPLMYLYKLKGSKELWSETQTSGSTLGSGSQSKWFNLCKPPVCNPQQSVERIKQVMCIKHLALCRHTVSGGIVGAFIL